MSLLLIATLLAANPDTLLTVDHYLDLEQVGDPQISPDGSRVAFVRGQSGAPAASAGSPSGRGRGNAGGGGNELWTRALKDGRESMVLRADDKSISGVGWSPDGESIVFTSGGGGGTGAARMFSSSHLPRMVGDVRVG